MSFLRWVNGTMRNLIACSDENNDVSLEGNLGFSGGLVAHMSPQPGIPPQPLRVTASEEIGLNIQERAVIAASGEAGVEAIRVSDTQAPAQSCASDLHQDGSITFSIRGRSRQGEEGNLHVCSILIEKLNQEGGHWSGLRDISKGSAAQEAGIDCEANDEDQVLKIQLTKAEPTESTWKALATGETSRRYDNASEVADDMRRVIEAKARKIIQVDQRRETLLGLDASETGAQVLTRVISSFRERHTDWAAQLNFRGIWVVGPTHDLTFRLDAVKTSS